MYAAYCYRRTSVVCLYVCVSVCYPHSCTLKKRLNRSRCRLEGRLGYRPSGVQIPKRRGQFWGCPAHWKALWVTVALYAAKKSITASHRHCCSGLQCCRLSVSHHFVSPVKKHPPPAMRPFVKTLWLLFTIRTVRVCDRWDDTVGDETERSVQHWKRNRSYWRQDLWRHHDVPGERRWHHWQGLQSASATSLALHLDCFILGFIHDHFGSGVSDSFVYRLNIHFTSSPIGVRSFVISECVCLSVCPLP